MTGYENILEKAVNSWRNNKGKGIAIIPRPFDERIYILDILLKMYINNPKCKVIIICDDFADRDNLVQFITHSTCEENNQEFKGFLDKHLLSIYTTNFAQGLKDCSFDLCILYKIKTYPTEIEQIFVNTRFKLVVLINLIDNAILSKLSLVVPYITEFNQELVEEVRTSTPVEEIRVGIPIPEDSQDAIQLNQCNSYITTSINIFGSFDIMTQARIGNNQLGISATSICNRIAEENGWTPQLDMSTEYNRKIDQVYNPNNLKERASTTYNIIRERQTLLACNNRKLETIERIINENNDKKILIISAYPDFASKITDYLNVKAAKQICMNFHDKVQNIDAVDNNGKPIFVQTGAHKGERRKMGAKAQMTLAMQLFNANKISILSANSAPNKDLSVNIDMIIITSPLCEDIVNYMYRLDKCIFTSPLKLYSLYIMSSLESKRLDNKPIGKQHTIKNENNLSDDEKNIDFAIAD